MRDLFSPKLFTILKEGYSRNQFISDILAGVVVGIVALPLAIAFAIASGVKPEQGLYTAIVTGFVVAMLGGSRVQVTGPTGAFIVVVYAIVQQYGYAGLAAATFMAGGMLVAMGIARLGGVLKFIPYSLTVGFTAGIALIIFSSQVKDFLGLTGPPLPGDFIGKWRGIFPMLQSVSLAALLLGIGSVASIQLWPRVTKKVPGSLVALVVSTLVVQTMQLPVETIGSRFGAVPHTLPAPHWIGLSLESAITLIRPALTIALLGAIESLLSATVADGMLGTRHRANTELIAQGVGNILSPLFSGIPATGAIARTATNVRSGGRAPVAAMVHALVLLSVLLLFGSWAEHIPMPTLAAILIVVAWNMSERHAVIAILRSTPSDALIMVSTFSLTVLWDLTVAIEVGIALSFLFFLREMRSLPLRMRYASAFSEEEGSTTESSRQLPAGVAAFELQGSLFFGSVDAFRNAAQATGQFPRVLILRMGRISTVDASGIKALESMASQYQSRGVPIILEGLSPTIRALFDRTRVIERIGARNICSDFEGALVRANELVGKGS